jgi:hypothetical protein
MPITNADLKYRPEKKKKNKNQEKLKWNGTPKFLGKYSRLIYWVQPLVAKTNSYMMLARRLVHKCTLRKHTLSGHENEREKIIA